MARAAAGGSRAVETFLRNFEGERARYQEILEITLCYGVQCLARTFSLKGISCHELRTITGYDTAKTKDFYVRNASRPIGKEGGVMQRTPVEVRAKPSHSWRDGEVEMTDFPEPSAVAESGYRKEKTAGDAGEGSEALYSLPPAFDEVDYHTKLLGKPLVDLAWKIFTTREGVQIGSKQELEDRLLRLEQRKAATMVPALELPVASFAEFLGAYVTECVRHAHPTGRAVDEKDNGSGEGHLFNDKQETIYGRRRSASSSRSTSDTGRRGQNVTPPAAMGNTMSVQSGTERFRTESKRPLHPQPHHRQQRQISRSLQHVQSKIQPELTARRQKILRVKKTQSQRMAESLARARLAEFDARRELQDVRDRPKRMPISEITKGAAALEIVDDFMRGPLMDKFGSGDVTEQIGGKHPSSEKRPTRRDPLKEELYGAVALDDSFFGCKPSPEPIRRPEGRPKQSKRNYNGWLGDFGLLHTKTVRPEWDEVDKTTEPEPRTGGTKFEWNFEHLPGGCHEHVNRDKPLKTPTRACFQDIDSDKIGKENNELDDALSDELSVNSDPVFRWLKDAV